MEFRLLGPLEVSDGNTSIPLGGPKQRLVLAHLVLRANQVVPAEVLIDAVWGEEPPQAARNTLQTYVSHLRKAIGNDRVAGRAPGYLLRAEPGEVDAQRFETALREARRLAGDPERSAEALREALALWRGSALADLALEPSIQGEAARLEELRLQALEEWIAAEMELGRHEELVPELEVLVSQHPLRERLWAHLMHALYRSGRQGEALGAFQRAREILADELGIDPSPDLQRLNERVLRQDETLVARGRPLRGYRLLEKIGEGSFGVVHRALQPGVERDVAIKTIHPQLANDPAFIRRFEREAQLVARLEHPHVVPLHDYWRDPDGAYLVMRYLSGGSLRQRIEKDGALRATDVTGLFDQISDALGAAHRQGVIHRDVKPDNVLLDAAGNAYLSDFGIATDVTRATMTARPSPGTPAYLSPEQIRGEPATEASDQYSLGIVLFEALTGEPPFSVETLQQLVEHHLNEPLPSPSSLRPDVPVAVDDVVARATAKEPRERFPDVIAVAVALRDAFGAGGAVARAAPVAAANPYKGLNPFREADEPDFFGRDALIRRLVDRMAEVAPGARFLAVVGPSGSGKSSVVRAGLVPALRAGAVDGSAGWFYAEMFPGAHPLEELESALLRVAVHPPPSLIEQLERDELGLLRAVKRILPDDGSEVVLVIDQFEELFTLSQDEGDRLRFLESIRTAVSDPRSRLRVVVTLRADLYDRPLLYPGFGELLAARLESITPMRADEIERAIAGPAERVGVRCHPGLLAEIVADVVDRPGALPLLQYALTELFERRTDGEMSLERYREIGGVAGALARRAEELYAAFDEKQRDACRQLLLRLVSLGEGREDTRRRVRLSELDSLETDSSAMRSVTSSFGEHRLLSFDRDPVSREPTVEVAHEALLRAWTRLRRWIDAARDDVRTHERLAGATSEWETGGRDPSFLLRGARLEQTGTWAAGTELALTRSERAFLSSSVELRDREANAERERATRERGLERRSLRRARALVAVLAVAALVAGTLTAIATDQRSRAEREARIATAQRLAAEAVASLETDPELAILLALEAVETMRDPGVPVVPEAEEALHRAVQTSRVVLSVPGHFGVAFSPAGTQFATNGTGGSVTLWDATTGERLRDLEGHEARVNNLIYDGRGRLLATSSEDGTARLWDAGTGEPVRTFSGSPVGLLSPALTPDGSILASTAHDGVVRVWDAGTGEMIYSREGGPGIAISADGGFLAAGGGPVVVREVASGREVSTVGIDAIDVAFAPDGDVVVTGELDGTVRLSDVTSGRELDVLFGHTAAVEAVDVSPDGSLIASASGDGTVRLWETATGRPVLALAGQGGSVENVDFSADGSQVIGGSSAGAAKVWDITPAGSRELLTFAAGAPEQTRVAVDPDGTRLLSSVFFDVPKIWDAQTGELLLSLDRVGPVFHATFSPDGETVATAGVDGRIRLIQATTGDELFGGPPGPPVTSVAFSPDGSLVSGSNVEGVATVLDVERGADPLTLEGHTGVVFDVAFGPEGDILATTSQDETARIWDLETGEATRVLSGHTNNVIGVDVSSDGAFVATGSLDGTVRIWELGTGEAVHVLRGHGGAVFGVAFDDAGERLVSTSDDGTARIWRVEDGRELLTLRGHATGVTAASFFPGGRHLATAGQDGTIRVYTLSIEELIDVARQRLTRGFTDQECRQYLGIDRCPG